MHAKEALLSDDRFVLAFYDVKGSAEASEAFLRSTVDWFTQLGYPPNKFAVGGEGHSGKMGEYRRGIAKLQKSGFSSVTHWSVKSSPPEASVAVAQFSASACFSRDSRTGTYAVVAVPCVSKEPVPIPLVRQLIERLNPSYGIGFERSLREGPIFYALGLNFSRIGDFKVATGEEYDERRSISRWSDIGMPKKVYLEGLLRYVYPWNFLTQPQLDRQVQGVPLAKWIEAGAGRGTLSPFCNDVSLWEVHEEELEPLRERLHEADAIFDWRKYCNVEPHIKTTLG